MSTATATKDKKDKKDKTAIQRLREAAIATGMPYLDADGKVLYLPERMADMAYRKIDYSEKGHGAFVAGADEDDFVAIRLEELGLGVMLTLLNANWLPQHVRNQLRAFAPPVDDAHIANVYEAHYSLLMLQSQVLENPDVDARRPLFLQVAGRPALVTMELNFFEYFGEGVLLITSQYALGDKQQRNSAEITNDFFYKDGVRRTVTREELLEVLGLRIGTRAEQLAYEEKVRATRELSRRTGLVLASRGPGLAWRSQGWVTMVQACDLGTEDKPYQVVVESELETELNTYDRNRQRPAPMMPYVRVFDFKSREFVYAYIDSVRPYEFDDAAMDKLSIDPAQKRALEMIFTPGARADTVDDIVRGKHGGVIIMAEGPPGVGKTMTAEVIAQKTHRPLYTIGLADLGTNLCLVETNLNTLLVRAERWNALLLIDEADVIMARRGEDLERSAIVGLFLHRIEYYRGFLFITTNRPEVMDPAVLDRLTLRMRYGPLTTAQRTPIWRSLLDNASITVDGDIEELSSIDIDGRRIRNTVRLVNLMHKPGATVSVTELVKLALQNK